MVTRRGILKGAAAGSIAAIASAHGVAAAPASAQSGFDAGFGNLEGGALAAFQKDRIGFDVFFKFYKSAAQVFYKEDVAGNVDVFFKFFNKGWTAFSKIETLEGRSLEGADAGFYKVQRDGAGFFVKFSDGSEPHYLNVGADGVLNFEGPQCEIHHVGAARRAGACAGSPGRSATGVTTRPPPAHGSRV